MGDIEYHTYTQRKELIENLSLKHFTLRFPSTPFLILISYISVASHPALPGEEPSSVARASWVIGRGAFNQLTPSSPPTAARQFHFWGEKLFGIETCTEVSNEIPEIRSPHHIIGVCDFSYPYVFLLPRISCFRYLAMGDSTPSWGSKHWNKELPETSSPCRREGAWRSPTRDPCLEAWATCVSGESQMIMFSPSQPSKCGAG